MVAAGFGASFEFFAQGCQKSFGTGAQATSSRTKQTPTKKPAERRAVKSKETLKYLKN
jgi:hypothetical protein